MQHRSRPAWPRISCTPRARHPPSRLRTHSCPLGRTRWRCTREPCERQEMGSVRDRFLLSLSGPRCHPTSKSAVLRGGRGRGKEFGTAALQRALWPAAAPGDPLRAGTAGCDRGRPGDTRPSPSCSPTVKPSGVLNWIPVKRQTAGSWESQTLWPNWESSVYGVPAGPSVHRLLLGPQLREVGVPHPLPAT